MDHLEKLGISSSGDEDYLVEDPASYPNIDIGIIYIKQIQTVSIELFISDDLSEAFPLIDIAYEFSKGNIEHESYIMKHGNPVAFVESIGCHVKIKRKEQTYTLMHKLDSGSTKSSIFSFNHTQNSVIQNLFRRRSFEWSDDSLEDSASKFAWATLGLFSNLTRLSREAFFESANDLRRPDKFSLNYIETFTNMRVGRLVDVEIFSLFFSLPRFRRILSLRSQHGTAPQSV